MKLRALLLILTTSILLANGPALAAQTPLAIFTASDGSGDPGDPGISVPVSLESVGGAQVYIANFDLNYDTDHLSVESIAIGSAISSAGKSYRIFQPSTGVIRVGIWDEQPDPVVIGDVPLAVVTFNVQGGALPGSSPLSLTDVVAGDIDAQAIDHEVNDGTFTVNAATETPTPTSTNTLAPTSTSTSAPGPSSTPSNTPVPSNTPTTGPSPTPSNTLPPTATHTPGPSPTASSTPSGTLSPTATGSITPIRKGAITRTPISEGAGEGLELEGAAAATGTALAKFEGSVAATSTALAEEVAARPTDEIVVIGPSLGALQQTEVLIAMGLLLFVIVFGGGAGYLIWRRQR